MPAEFLFLVRSSNEGYLPSFPGELVRGMFLDVIREKNPNLSKFLHDYPKVKPYAIKPLAPISRRKRIINGRWFIKKGELFRLSFSILMDNYIDDVEKALIDLEGFKLGDIKFEIVEPPNIKKRLYRFFRTEEIGSFLLDFRTPVTFKAIEEEYMNPFPEPPRILRSLIRIYSAFSGDENPPRPPDYIEVAGYCIKTREVSAMGLKFIGSKGWVLYRIMGQSKDLSKLLQLASFSNIGMKRTLGLGVVKVKTFVGYNKRLLKRLFKSSMKKRKQREPKNPIEVTKRSGDGTELIQLVIEKQNNKSRMSLRDCAKIAEMLNLNLPKKLKNGKIILLLRNYDELMSLIENRQLLSEYKINVTNIGISKPNITKGKIRIFFTTPTKLPTGFPSVEAIFRPICEEIDTEKDVKNHIYVKIADLIANEEGFRGFVEYIIPRELENLGEILLRMILFGIGEGREKCKGNVEIEYA